METSRFQIQVNGESIEVDPGTDISRLIALRKLTPDKVAVELNRRLVKSGLYQTVLRPGDQIEIVTFVGGGA